jgi:hypothetical protein
MDSGATVVTMGTHYVTSGRQQFVCGVADFTDDPSTQENPYYFLYSRKFTFCFQGGFDGWDIYREFRTNQDRFAAWSIRLLTRGLPSIDTPTQQEMVHSREL